MDPRNRVDPPREPAVRLPLYNIDHIPGAELEALGLVRGAVVRSKHLGQDLAAGIMAALGGEIADYTDLLNEARAVATARMAAEAEALGADAVVNVRYSTSQIMDGAAEVLAYGTAVRIK